MQETVPIGIMGTGIYIPEHFMTSAEVARASGLPQEVIERKLGFRRKPVPGPEDHTCQMGIWAAERALAESGIKPEEIDLIISVSEEHKEYPVWTAGIKLQQEIGAVRAWAFDVALRCGTTILALKLAKSLMLTHADIKTVLVAGGYRNSDLVDYRNPRARFLYNLAAGGAAVLLRKGYSRNRVLESIVVTDGAFSEDVAVVAGGTRVPMTVEALARRQNYLDVFDPEGMKKRLDAKSMANFVRVVRESVGQSGYKVSDIAYLAILHMKRSAHERVLRELGLREEQAVYLEDYGHLGQIDQVLSLRLALAQGRIKDGDVVVLVSAGIGYAWDAVTIRWGGAS
ncbi:beta-ketoacyl-[acyl-carrier-protein] synthase III/beta-ketoacyl-[acyl-carrier-protein] synthase I [Acididesulfobacillus acetoxydans]|uniref:3-oxoacyl-[acyl-carrier-protein] synthase III n=1 Tax=Acididesulfobacillus acetoxydans TaxID=1561005 RepID=A0A8S0WKJ1_9FIRM|nr:3-oxoacyl-ACP synthase [Acididesulfobacillus acetoxydans]CAA7599414.1 beta-ketoacyl-[acyl-carrier-protein] synthase III/beta-ketoacyl-[acyl-carrier-protein] synthase I [Acididesulfobacillus acetoxydans]CEJ06780.1 3-oxoacyl-[acyl-carrier-protein] synthase III [Acididesulfobacillus acetoxydans]